MSEPASEPIVLPAKADIDAAEKLTTDLRAFGTEPGLAVDASEVEKMSTPIILALVSALNTRAELSPPLTVINPSTPFVDAFTDIGLFQELMKMEFAS